VADVAMRAPYAGITRRRRRTREPSSQPDQSSSAYAAQSGYDAPSALFNRVC